MAHFGVLWAIVLAGALVTGGGDLTGPAQLAYAPGAVTSLAEQRARSAAKAPRRAPVLIAAGDIGGL